MSREALGNGDNTRVQRKDRNVDHGVILLKGFDPSAT